MSHSEVSDNELLREISEGNNNAFEMLFKQHYNNLCRYAFTFVKDSDEAEDIVQKMFVTFWEKRTILSVQSSIKSYLYGAVRNSALNKLKHEQVKRKFAAEAPSNDIAHEATDDHVVSSELEEKIKGALGNLPEQCRIVFELSRFEGMKYTEIADHLGISVKTVENQMGKALRRMRTDLQDYLPGLLILGLIIT